jgi:hypothetical protein
LTVPPRTFLTFVLPVYSRIWSRIPSSIRPSWRPVHGYSWQSWQSPVHCFGLLSPLFPTTRIVKI